MAWDGVAWGSRVYFNQSRLLLPHFRMFSEPMGDGLGLRRTWLVDDLPPAVAFTIVRWGGQPGASSLICQASSSIGLRVPRSGRERAREGCGPQPLILEQSGLREPPSPPQASGGERASSRQRHTRTVALLVPLLPFPL